ncbi:MULTISPECIES: HAD-IIA family hydrolase [Halobacterium]|uniref:HAD-IIA family hydrolase n=1 Tax=Halobacterium TaxID=2239 RepID=UPI001964859B|nr:MULTISPECIES: HAD-IIA family hydrolase [Halobacterium]MCF2166420.1 HAD-IIA family hydrolase [Halobacterium salinarum]MCF2168415.1 HAD-IIA family hydrolase [Halobacterium salinarum]QRY23365.1 HAD-IIA family hydrolase [Halobacterium sp. GSL-19]WJK64614.1 HAD-IIA family hydrolase [Halobacterium salinarum]
MTYRGVVLDLDGTVLRGDTLLPGAEAGVAALREHANAVLFLTNNPMRPASEHAARLEGLGVDATPSEVLTATDATITYLQRSHDGAAVYPIAADAITAQLRAAGVAITADPVAADVVVAGFDPAFGFQDLQAAVDAFADGTTALVGTDPDITIPAADGAKPGSGAIVQAVAGVAERDPDAVLGKPSETTARLAVDRLGVPPAECLVVGDRPDTDVALGAAAGMTTALVRTGVDAAAPAHAQPDHVLDSLGEIGRLIA